MVVADEQTPLLRGRNDEEHKEENPLKSTDETPPEKKTKPQSGWSSIVIVAVLFSVGIVFEVLIVVPVAFVTGTAFDAQSVTWWALTFVLHIPYFVILVYLFAGLVERVGYMFLDCGCTPYVRNTDLHDDIGYPTVCVQLAMFNEHEVSERIIQAACNIAWATEKLEIQVLDDSTDLVCREIVDRCIADCRKDHPNLSITLQRREKRTGLKAGALEEGRKKTNAMFLALFDADFVPTTDFLVRAVPLFYKENDNHAGSSPKWISDDKLALVQAQWGHLNAFDSPLTMSQSMWIDDHHSVQMMWRARVWCVVIVVSASSLFLSFPPHFFFHPIRDFVNFTGTAGLWRASAIETAGGWKHASLVEDCELSFRVLFSGYRTTFDSSNVQPAELPDSVTAYKAQQKRWTQGWVQLCRMHFGHLIWSYECTVSKRVALIYHMLITWQWPFWLSWLLCFPFMLWYDLTFIALGDDYDLFYIVPMGAWLLFMASLATYKTKYTYKEELGFFNFFFRAYVRLIPYIVINSGMLPHQVPSCPPPASHCMQSQLSTPAPPTATHRHPPPPTAVLLIPRGAHRAHACRVRAHP